MKNKKRDPDFSYKEMDFGERRISKMNFSHIVTIPKIFVQNTAYERITTVRITMLEDGCLKLTPTRAKNGDHEVDLSSL